MKKSLICLLGALAGSVSLASGIQMKHTVTLKPGWNAFYLPITLTNNADKVFADWPVETVGFYDQAAFLATKQFTTGAEDSSQGAIDSGMKMWKRGDLAHSSFDTLVANGVYVTVNTNRTEFSCDLYGEPSAYRVTWHVSDGVTRPVNYVGISSSSSAKIAADGYLSGLDVDWSTRWSIGGIPTAAAPQLTDIAKNPTLGNGEVVAMDAKKVSDWSGVLNVSPMTGISMSTNLTTSIMSIRNDAGTNRCVKVSFHEGTWEDGKLHAPVPTVKYLDLNVHTNWQESLRAVPYERELAPGETLKLKLAIDRSKELLSEEPGVEYGGIIDVEDVSSEEPSSFKTSIPLSALSSGKDKWKTMWPKGLWVANVTLDKVGRAIAEENVEEYVEEIHEKWELIYDTTENEDGTITTNGSHLVSTAVTTNMVPVLTTPPIPVAKPMNLRLLMHVDVNGTMNLLERVRIGGRRLSAPVLPTDTPEIVCSNGTFGVSAEFNWTVAETSKVNPFRHAKHPDHDGKDYDFKGAAPSGDDFNNYLQVVKPELFSIKNELKLKWDESTAASWSPEETLSGTCDWALTGLRREGPIKMSGTFTMRRITDADLNELKD